MNMTQKKHFQSTGAIDIHIHGAYGIDLMSATDSQLSQLSLLLWQRGIAGFCPTTLSTSADELLETVRRLGRWIHAGKFPGARPLGIHLEGPFIHKSCCGAHPPSAIRKFTFEELNHLWAESQKTLKILTLAPETLTSPDETHDELRELGQWCNERDIHLSLGHSAATEVQARKAFQFGFRGVTHAWNALPFHHRNLGVMGAALGADIYLELIADQVHVAPTLIRWTLALHPPERICFVSDCLAAGGDLENHPKNGTLGPLQVHFQDGACRLPNGNLAGGGLVLTDSFNRWLSQESTFTQEPLLQLLQRAYPQICDNPLRLLNVSNKTLAHLQVQWIPQLEGGFQVIPIDSQQCKR